MSKYDDDDYEEKERDEDYKSDCHGRGFSEGKECKEDSLSDHDLIEKVQDYFFLNEELSQTFEHFVEMKCNIVDLDSDEYKLEYTDCYNEYKALFEDKVTHFIERNLKSSITEFYRALKRITDGDENSNLAVFGQILVSVTDFDIFMQMMREGARQHKMNRGK